ncbi:19010_t:CDS:2, partial [Gigaspora rosea]
EKAPNGDTNDDPETKECPKRTKKEAQGKHANDEEKALKWRHQLKKKSTRRITPMKKGALKKNIKHDANDEEKATEIATPITRKSTRRITPM